MTMGGTISPYPLAWPDGIRPFTLAELAACAEREVKQRRKVYSRLIGKRTMTQADADRETAMMEQIAREYRKRAVTAGELLA